MTLTRKLGLLLFAFTLAMGTVTALNFATSRRVGVDVDFVERKAYPQLSRSIRAQAQFEEIAHLIEDAAATGESSFLDDAAVEREAFTVFIQLLHAEGGASSRPTVLRIRSDFADYYDAAVGLAALLLTLEALEDDDADEIERRGRVVGDLRTRLTGDLSSLVSQYEAQMTSGLGEARRRVRWQSRQALVISAATSIVLLVLLLSVSRSITTPLRSLVAFTADVGKGEFDRPMEIPGLADDEIGVLASSFDHMARELGVTTVSRSFLDDIIASMADSLIVIGADGVIESVNGATCAMLGYDEDALVGVPVRVVAPDAHDALIEVATDPSNHAEVRALETTYHTATGGHVPVSLSSSPIRRGGQATRGAVCVAQDITERRDVQRMKDEFIATLSHELRTPLTAIVSSLDILTMGVVGELSDKGRALTEIGQRNGRRLVRLIDDVLDLSRIESGELAIDIQAHDLAAVVVEAVEANQGYADQFGVKLAVGGETLPVTVLVDRGRMMQVMANLLSNAAKFSPKGSTVTVTGVRHGSGARVSVIDEGVGIPPDALDKVFERFYQVDGSSTRDRGGAGLGLSISRAIVEEFGGEMGLDSVLGVGSTFWVQLRVADEPPEGPDADGPRVSESAPLG
jgi:PAS domain S-box-containing protein